MTAVLLSALLIGAIGSLHCIGMCGPLALALPIPAVSPFAKMMAALLYNLGRVVTYAVIGAVIGLVGTSFSLFGFQQWLSILSGSAILVYLLWPQLPIYRKGHQGFQSLLAKLRGNLGQLFRRKNYKSVFFIGLLNGLLPCGLVYMALAASLALGSFAKSSIFMGAFGMGTLPLMWSLAFFGTVIPRAAALHIKKIYPYIMFLMGCMLIIRGMGLGIPYISPQWHPADEVILNGIDCHAVK